MLSNNNPLNIRFRSEGYWQGQAPSGPHSPQFCRFYDMKWGFRAAFRLLLTYYVRYHLTSIEKIVMRWAPPNENNTQAYIHFVVNDLRNQGTVITKDIELPHPREAPRLWIPLVLAMAKMECGPKHINLTVSEACKAGYHLLFD